MGRSKRNRQKLAQQILRVKHMSDTERENYHRRVLVKQLELVQKMLGRIVISASQANCLAIVPVIKGMMPRQEIWDYVFTYIGEKLKR